MECEIYNYGSGIFNFSKNPIKRTRTDNNNQVKILYSFPLYSFPLYENKIHKIKKIIYFYKSDDPLRKPIFPLYFINTNQVNKYIKENKEYMTENYGKLGVNYFIENCNYTILDIRTKECN